MSWHVLSSTYFDFDRFASESKADTLPQHLLPEIADRLNAPIHQPLAENLRRSDKVLSRLYGRPEHWALARRVLEELSDGDAVYSAGCDSGIPLALRCALRRRNVAFAINFADPSRVRARVLGWLIALTQLEVVAFVTTGHQAGLLEKSFGRRLHAVHVVEGQTDCAFFRPLPNKPCLLYTSPSPRDATLSRMPSSA